MEELNKIINNALNENVDLSKEEYKEKIMQADKATAGHGLTQKVSVNESTRHKRIQMNYYGISLNYLANLLGEIATQTQLIQEQNLMLLALLKEKNINVNECTTKRT